MTRKIVVALLLATLTTWVATAYAQAANPPRHATTPPRHAKLFRWSMPSRFGTARDARGRIVEARPGSVRRGPWGVDFTLTHRACVKGAAYSWEVDGRPVRLERRGKCAFSHRFPAEGPHRVRLDARIGGTRLTQTKKVVVQDWLIVSLGDSVASGEAVPDVPDFERATWESVRCHRSARAGPALAAKQIEEDDRHSSVTFVHLACSGATVPAGLLGPYQGAEPLRGRPPLEAQVRVLNRIAKRRRVDAVLLSIGANDIHFGDVVRFCAIPAANCFEEPLPKSFGGDGKRTAEEVVRDSLRQLAGRYRRLARRISHRIPPSRVHIVAYFDPTRDAEGNTCDRILVSITRPELELARSRMLAPLNAAVASAARRYGWDLVGGVASLFRDHGYCAGSQAWVTTLTRSVEGLGGTLKGRFLGTLHPNRRGQEATATLISAALERSLYPGRIFPERPPPGPEAEGSSGIGSVAATALLVMAGLAASALLGPASILVSLGLLLWVLIPAVLALDPNSGGLILLGFAVGVAILVWPGIAQLAAKPVLSLAKSFRPLLLPLLAVIAVGTVKWSLAVQILVSAAALVVAWSLIVVPEAEKSGVPLEPGPALALKIAIHSAIAVTLGILAVLAVRLLGLDSPYFAAIDDVPSGLLLLAVALTGAAFVLRLFSFATTQVRAVLAFDIGLALLVLAMAIGVLPGNPAVHDAWPQLFAVFAGVALVLLAVEAVRSVLAGPPPPPAAAPAVPEPRPLTSRAAGLGFSAAAVAAVVIAVSTGVGMVVAAEKGQPLNPPEEESAEARVPSLSATAGGGSLELAEKYAPVLVFTNAERWAPVRVNRYVREATLDGPPGTPHKLKSIKRLPHECREFGQSRCYTLSIECESGELDCAHWSQRHHEPERLYKSGAVYVRVLKKGEVPDFEPRDAFADRGPFRRGLRTLIQYWYFYYYDEWKAPVFAGLLTQRHEGDWEAVTIGLDGRRRPLFVADSAHCAGSWRRWKEIEVSTLPPGPHIHPLVAVAEGSHANYPDPRQRRSPDWASCAGAPAGVTTAVSYASNIRDKTEYGWPWYPRHFLLVDASKPPMDFPGTWGADDRTTLRNFRSNELGSPGLGPKTPTLQALWQEPVRTIFCGKYTPKECLPE